MNTEANRLRYAFKNARANVRGVQVSQKALAARANELALTELRKLAQEIVFNISASADGEMTLLKITAETSRKTIEEDGKVLRGQVAQIRDPDIDQKSVQTAIDSTDQETINRLYGVLKRNTETLATSSTDLVDKVQQKLPELEQAVHETGTAVITHIDQVAQTQMEAIDIAEHGLSGQQLNDPGGYVETTLTQAFDGYSNECDRARGEAQTNYHAAKDQLIENTKSPIATANTTWHNETITAINAMQSYTTEAVAKHAELLPLLMRSTGRKIWDGVKDGAAAFGKGMLQFVGAVLLVAVAFILYLGTAVIGTALAAAVIIVGAVLVTISILTNFVRRLQQLGHNQWPWYFKLISIPCALGIAVGDTVGVTRIVEGMTGRQLFTDQKLTTEDRAAAVTEGSLQILTAGISGRRAVKSKSEVPETQATTEANTVEPASPAAEPERGAPATARDAVAAPVLTNPFAIAARVPDCEYELGIYHLDINGEIFDVRVEYNRARPQGWRLSGVAPHARVNAIGLPRTLYSDFVVQQLSNVRDYFLHKPGTEVEDTSQSPKFAPNVLDAIPTAKHWGRWVFDDRIITNKEDGTKFGETRVVHIDNSGNFAQGRVARAYNPATGELTLVAAFRQDLPKWIRDPNIPDVIEGKGIPTGQFLTLRLMKILGVTYKSPQTVTLSMIQNTKSVLQFNVGLLEGLTPEQAVMRTETFRSAQMTLAQVGRVITNVRVGLRARGPFDYNHYESFGDEDGFPDPERIAENNRLIEQYGKGKVKRETDVEWNFDIELTTSAAETP